MAEYNFGASYDAIEAFIETLSGWYLRLSRSKAWGSGHSPAKAACYEVLQLSLDVTARLVAPFMPFVAEALYQALGSGNRCIWRIGPMLALIGLTTVWPER